MSIKDIISVIGGYIAVKVIDKFIEDNLPNLHYKNLFNKYVIPAFVLAYIGILIVVVKITNDPAQKKNLLNIMLAIVVLSSLDKLKQQKTDQQTA